MSLHIEKLAKIHQKIKLQVPPGKMITIRCPSGHWVVFGVDAVWTSRFFGRIPFTISNGIKNTRVFLFDKDEFLSDLKLVLSQGKSVLVISDPENIFSEAKNYEPVVIKNQVEVEEALVQEILSV
jgi:hypothetical protein